jgi:hypothetical protein
MRPPREQSQHASSIFCIARFTENEVVNRYNRVRAEHITLRMTSKNRHSLFPCKPLRALPRRFAGKRRLVNVSRLHSKRNPGVAQQLLASRRSRGKYNSHEAILSEYSPKHRFTPPRTPRPFSAPSARKAFDLKPAERGTGPPVKIKNHDSGPSQAAASC